MAERLNMHTRVLLSQAPLPVSFELGWLEQRGHMPRRPVAEEMSSVRKRAGRESKLCSFLLACFWEAGWAASENTIVWKIVPLLLAECPFCLCHLNSWIHPKCQCHSCPHLASEDALYKDAVRTKE